MKWKYRKIVDGLIENLKRDNLLEGLENYLRENESIKSKVSVLSYISCALSQMSCSPYFYTSLAYVYTSDGKGVINVGLMRLEDGRFTLEYKRFQITRKNKN